MATIVEYLCKFDISNGLLISGTDKQLCYCRDFKMSDCLPIHVLFAIINIVSGGTDT